MRNIEMLESILESGDTFDYRPVGNKDGKVFEQFDNCNLNLMDLYFHEIVKYPLLTVEQEIEIGKKLKLKKDVEILSTLKNCKDSLIVDLESIFISITNKAIKEYVLEKLRYYYDNNEKQEANSTKIVKYYLDEYEKLCKISETGIPNELELNSYFSDKKYDEFSDFDVAKRMSFIKLIEQLDLFLQYMIARDMLINCNLRLVVKFAKAQVTSRMGYLDCIEEGNLGLIRAVDDFDVDKGFKFSTYASTWILQYIQRAKENKEMPVRIPTHMHTLIKKIERTERNYFINNGRFPTELELSEILDLPVSKICDVKSVFYHHNCSSLDVYVGERAEETVGDFVLDVSSSSDIDDWTEQISDALLVSELMSGLTEKEQDILKYRFGFYSENQKGVSLEKIGEIYGVTRERIRQIEEKALCKMNRKVKSIQARGRYYR